MFATDAASPARSHADSPPNVDRVLPSEVARPDDVVARAGITLLHRAALLVRDALTAPRNS
jgi:hypothetical protein